MSLEDLQQLAEGSHAAIETAVFNAVNKKSEFLAVLEEDQLRHSCERMMLVLKVLNKAIASGVNVGAISLVLHSKLLHSLLHLNLTILAPMCRSNPAETRDLLCSEVALFDVVVKLSPSDEALSIEACANSIRMLLLDSDNSSGPDLELNRMLCRIRENLALLREAVEERDKGPKMKGILRHGRSHLVEPPENFRSLPILPSLNDILSEVEPFLRANILCGRYLNADHYVDVQFRLMKEDFVRTLREGVAQIMTKHTENVGDDFTQSHNSIENFGNYGKGVITGIFHETIGFTLELKISLRDPSQAPLEFRKRLIYGSLLCLTNDNFKSMLLASVAEQKFEDLKRGFIRIRPENSQFDLNAWTTTPEYLIVETCAFFEAYRQVLSALQRIDLENYPLKKYILYAEKRMSLPKYILEQEGEDSQVFPMEFGGKQFVGNPFSGDWPEPEELGLDKAQFRAFKAGLCREFALIQGPPGTGKNYLGLKLVQTILLRRQEFQIDDHGPILILCFTNHNLDRFLDGVRSYTQKILQIGGKFPASASLEPFTVRNAVLNSDGNAFRVSRDIWSQLLAMQSSLNELEILKKGLDDEIAGTTDLLDFNIGGKTSAEAQRRNIESIYDIKSEVPESTIERKSECIQRHFEISIMSAEQAVKNAEEEVKILSEKLKDFVEDPEDGTTFHELMKAELRLQDAERQKTNLKADSRFWKISSNVELVEPPEKIVGFEENWINARQPKARWLIYRYWVYQFLQNLSKKINADMEEYKILVERYKEAQNAALICHSRCLDVVGMTTTAAVQNLSFVQNIRAKVVVVEEAAEVLESHIVCCLSPDCEHLILIGDHQLVRPSTTAYQLGTNFGMDVSMFERMLKNHMPHERLIQQRRMQPNISNMLKLHVHEDLQDHSSVAIDDDVVSVAKNVFFVTCNSKEVLDEGSEKKSNMVLEAEFLLAFCRYLLLQGYQHEQILILTTYSEQLLVFKKFITSSFPMCVKVRITSTDDYEGEESDIILLSLVTWGNLEGSSRSSKTDSRDVAAISRAKKGLFMIGNMDALSSGSEIWRNIEHVLVKENQIGRALPLQCQNHPDEVIFILKPNQFPASGGCNRVKCETKCSIRLECGHACEKSCHVKDDPKHVLSKCWKPCGKSCPREHPCAGIYSCVSSKTDSRDVAAISRAKKGLFMIGNMDALSSGSEIWRNIEHVLLKENQIGRALPLQCQNHPDEVIFILKPNQFPASGGCNRCDKILSCGHQCQKMCVEDCGDCLIEVEKVIPDCSHSVKLPCFQAPTKGDCGRKCEKVLPCGHKCAEKCCNECTTKCSVMMKVAGNVGKCGHQERLPCHIATSSLRLSADDKMQYCSYPCGKILSCGHACVGKCYQCFRGSIHVPCKEPCRRRLVCGHICTANCCLKCLPCKERCAIACPHSVCGRLCWERCVPCSEKCLSGCRHKPCKRKCSEDCGKGDDKCNEPCEKVLDCRHKCVGFCGEICPPCRECAKDAVDFFNLTTNSACEEPNARFVRLEECNHVLEADGLDKWMRTPLEVTGPRVCPRCKAPILYSHRYKDEVNAALREVTAEKERFFDKDHDVSKIYAKLMDKTESSPAWMINKVFADGSFILIFLDEIENQQDEKSEMTFKTLNWTEFNSISNRINLIGAIAALILKSKEDNRISSDFKSRFERKLKKLAKLVMLRKHNLNEPELKVFMGEIQRFCDLAKRETMRTYETFLNETGKTWIVIIETILCADEPYTQSREAEVGSYLQAYERDLSSHKLLLEEKWSVLKNWHFEPAF
ncbi:unnamed protein product [Notodromas monacha]|uniref:NF-X1-type domain-containing protein n=1 Tax=Notodromas monacha TaxID=399045 RepID=A0A7R9GEG9_9CRUS|nr:unnamed protein product [Notodromas monacha]CAG0919615.1 unnamed protein product [Notodromas monacha]